MLFQIRFILPLIAILALGACASAPLSPLSRPSPDAQGEVIVFRESAFVAGAVSLTVGSGADAFASIGNSEKVRAMFPTGERDIYVQARSAKPTRLRVVVNKNMPVCLRTSSSPSAYAKVIVPIVFMATGYHFYLDEVPCPPAEELAKYKDVPVAYR